MKKFLVLLLALISVFGMTSCASTDAPAAKADAEQTVVVLGKNGIPMPEWVVNDVSTQDYLKVSASAKKSREDISVKAAEVAARAQIAEYVNSAIKEVTTTYINEAGEGDNTQTLEAFESIAMMKAQSILNGSKREAKWVSAEGEAYVLVSIPMSVIEEQLYGAAEEAVEKTFKENEAAAAANSKMNAAIDKFLF